MQMPAPSTRPACSQWGAEQPTLFPSDRRFAYVHPQAIERRVSYLVDGVGIPSSHRGSYTQALCEGVPIDPGFILWLREPGRRQCWLTLMEAFVGPNASVACATVRTRAHALLVRADATRAWPQSAVTALHAHRIDSGAFELATFPPLPPLLRPWRYALHTLAMQTRAELYDCLAQPIVQCSSQRVSTVEVLGCFRLRFDFEGRHIRVDQMGEAGWLHAPELAINLVRPLADDSWCDRFALRMSDCARVAMRAAWQVRELRAGCLSWLADLIRQLATRSKLMEHVSELIRVAYPCDPQLIRDVIACTIEYHRDHGLTTDDYVAAWQHAEILRQRVTEAPQLAPIWGLARSAGHLQITDGYDVLRTRCQQSGVKPAGWQLLVRYGRQLYWPLMAMTDPRLRWSELTRYVRLLQRAQSREPMPLPLMKALFAPHWFWIQLYPIPLPLGLLRGAIERIKSPMPLGAMDAFIEHEFVPVLGWIAREVPRFDSNQQRASWTWFYARYQEWCEAEKRARDGRRWDTGIAGLRWRGFHITPIRDSVTLWTDGEQMRMCLSTYEERCAAGQYIVYAVRTPGRVRPVAHIGIRLSATAKGELDQVRGFANASVEPALMQYARQLAAMHGHSVAVEDSSDDDA